MNKHLIQVIFVVKIILPIIQPINKYLLKIGNTEKILSWESKGLSDEMIKPPTTSNNRLGPELNYLINKIKVKFNGSCLKQETITYTHGIIVNIYIVYKLSSIFNTFDPTLKIVCLEKLN